MCHQTIMLCWYIFICVALMATEQVTDTIYTWTRLPSRWTESANGFSYTFLCAVGSVIVCLHKVVCDWSLFSATFQAFVLPMPLCGVLPKLPYCVVITSNFFFFFFFFFFFWRYGMVESVTRTSRLAQNDRLLVSCVFRIPAWNHNVLQSFG